MNIKRLDPLTQQTLRRLDYNQDDQLSAKELSLLKAALNGPKIASNLGIAPQDRAVIQEALKKATQPDQIVVSLVDESAELPPGLKSAPTISGKPAPQDVEPPVFSFNTTPKIKQNSADPDDKELTGVDLKAGAQWGGLKLQATTSANDNAEHLGASLSSTYTAGALEIGANADASPLLNGSEAGIERVNLHGQTSLGKVKLRSEGSVSLGSKELESVSATAEIGVAEGHNLRATARPNLADDKNTTWSSVEVGTSHKIGALNLNTKALLNQASKEVYGAGVSYDVAPGINLNAQADTERNISFGASMKFKF
ncbi:MAG: hypothetical protein ACO1RX_17725 [Candidatus Sericytochromatia bacterium]